MSAETWRRYVALPPRQVRDRVRLGWTRRGLVLGVALLGLGMLALSGGVAAVIAALGAAGVLAGFSWESFFGRTFPQSVFRVATPAAAMLLLALPLLGVPWAVDAAGLLAYLLVNQSAVARGPREERRILLVAVLMGLLGCILTISPWLGVLLGLLAFLAPAALLCVHLADEEGTRAHQVVAVARGSGGLGLGGLGLACVIGSALIYLVIPRIQGGYLAAYGQRVSLAGFSGEVILGDTGTIRDNPVLVFRARVTDGAGRPLQGPFYFRGVALDTFDGRKWTALAGGRVVVSHRPGFLGLPEIGANVVNQEIQIEPLAEGVLPGIPDIRDLTLDLGDVWRDGNGGYHWGGAPRRLAYLVRSVRPTRDPARLSGQVPDPVASSVTAQGRIAAMNGVYLGIPADLDPRVVALAHEVVRGADSAYDKAVAVETFLRRSYTWTDSPPDPGDAPPLSVFLFDARVGHCEYFATALAVLLRIEGVPVRLVNGFYGGEWNRVGEYVVIRQSDAHSWVEVNLGDAGWLPFDATPTGERVLGTRTWWEDLVDVWVSRWYALILDYDLGTQLEALAGSGFRISGAVGWSGLQSLPSDPARASGAMLLPLGLAGILGLCGAVAWRLLRPWLAGERGRVAAVEGIVARCHRRARRLAGRRGWRIPEGLPPLSAARWLEGRVGDAASPLRELAWLHYRVRYGGESDASLAVEAREALRRFGSIPPRRGA